MTGLFIATGLIALSFTLFGIHVERMDTLARRSRMGLHDIACDKWLCNQIADALEIPSDQGSPAEYVMFALQERARLIYGKMEG